MFFSHKQFTFGLASLFLVSFASQSLADYTITNRSSEPVYVSVCWFEPSAILQNNGFGLTGQGRWNIKGWFKIDPGKKRTLIYGDMRRYSKNIYFYANTPSGNQYSGNLNLRLHPRSKFHYFQKTDGSYYVEQNGTYLTPPNPHPGSVLRPFIHVNTNGYTNYNTNLN